MLIHITLFIKELQKCFQITEAIIITEAEAESFKRQRLLLGLDLIQCPSDQMATS